MKSLPLTFLRAAPFAAACSVCLCLAPFAELQAADESGSPTAALLKKFDRNKDGKLTGKEIPAMLNQRLRQVDRDGDGQISTREIDRLPANAVSRLLGSGDKARPARRPGGAVSTPGKKGLEGEFYAPAAREEFDPELLEIGDAAPDFTLERYDKKGKVTLSDFEGKKPVVLVFGSITCQPFRQKVAQVSPIYEQYKDQAEFLMVYIREAHPESVLTVEEGGKDVLKRFVQTNDYKSRVASAAACYNLLDLPYPIVVDKEDNQVKEAWSGWPIRLMVVNTKGKLVFDGGRGPGGFQPEKLKAWLKANL